MNQPQPAAKTATASRRGAGMKKTETLSEGQRAYESRRAAKAGMSLEKWLETKEKDKQAEARARQKAAEPEKQKKPNFLSKLLERAQKPL